MALPDRDKGKILTFKVVDRLKQALVKEGLLRQEQLRSAEIMAQQEHVTLATVLIKSGFMTEEQLASFIGEKVHIPYVDLNKYAIDRKVLDLIPVKTARYYRIIPIFMIEDVLTIAMADPLNIIAFDEIAHVAGCKIEPVIASGQSVEVAIDHWYGMGDARQSLIDRLAEEFQEQEQDDTRRYGRELTEIRLRKDASEPPIVKLVNSYIAQALLEGASDIHLEPKRDSMAIRFRIDGFLYPRHQLPSPLIPKVTSRIKIMSLMDITQRRVPQDGRISLVIRDKSIDIRTSTFPTMHGENIVLRILDKTRGVPTLSELGFSDEDFASFKKVIRATKGIILSTGPTGSGKTTTLYSAMNTLNAVDKNIMTIEDPIEYEIEGIVQSQVDPKAGATFANALRSILRQDPDIIYVGEIRDLETAEIAVRAALTGHLVFSTLHTNDAVGAIMRLRDIGIESALIESVLHCSFAQRLVRRVCPRCKKSYHPDASVLKRLGLPAETTLYKGEGCEFCNGIGYKGRIGLFEILVVDKHIRQLIAKNAHEDLIVETARAHGMTTLCEDGLRKAVRGMTTIEEVERATEEVG